MVAGATVRGVATSSATTAAVAGAVEGPPSEAEFIRVLRRHALLTVDVSEEHAPRDGVGVRGLSSGELQGLCDLSRPSVAGLIKRFAPVLERQDADGHRLGAGKQARRWMIDASAGSLLGFEVGQERTQVAKFDLFGRLLDKVRLPAAATADQTIVAAVSQLRAILNGRSPSDVVGIGVSLAAPVEQGRGVRAGAHALASAIETDPPWDDWQLMLVREQLRDRLGWGDRLPILLENDANLGALAELTWGAGRPSPLRRGPYRNVIYVEWSRGVGAGLILNGELYRGEGVAGEIGHTVIYDDDRARECERCGNSGCLETLAGWGAILDGLQPGRKDLTLHGLKAILARAHDPSSPEAEAFGEAARQVGRVLGPLIHLLNPQLMIIGGDVGQLAYEVVREPLNRSLKRHTMRPALADVAVVAAKLKTDAALRGTAALIVRPEAGQPDRLLAFLRRKCAT